MFLRRKTVSTLGWYGVLAILAAYALLNFGVFSARSVTYQLLNFTGAAAFIAETYSKKDYQPMLLNVIWLLIATFALVNILVAN